AGGGTNGLDYSRSDLGVEFDLQRQRATAIGGGWSNLTRFVGPAAGGTLIGPDAGATWTIAAADTGDVGGVWSFQGFGDLTGGDGDDVFRFLDGASVSGQVDGGHGVNALDYSAYTTGVVVNLRLGTATGTAGGLKVANVTGGAGADPRTGGP